MAGIGTSRGRHYKPPQPAIGSQAARALLSGPGGAGLSERVGFLTRCGWSHVLLRASALWPCERTVCPCVCGLQMATCGHRLACDLAVAHHVHEVRLDVVEQPLR